jgi:DNA-binding transcriptional regulator YhcF (GntR family)
VQIANHFTTQIKAGELAPDTKLPAIAEIARQWGVATATAAKAVKQLQADGYVRSSSQGTFVEATESPMLSFRLPAEVREQFDAITQAEGRDRGDALVEAVNDWIRKRRSNRQ